MARHGDEYFLARRFADRGNERRSFYSCARGEDRCPNRRVADRGSGGVCSDPRDLKKIKRLRQRVRDLEEIERLRKRVRDLELQREMRKAETESSTIVWDEGGDGEQQPFSRHPHRFYEPIYHEGISEDGPRFDEDGVDFDKDECLFVKHVLSGLPVETESMFEHAKVSAEILNEFLIAEKSVAGDDMVDVGGKTMSKTGCSLHGGDEPLVESSTNMPWTMENLQLQSQSSESHDLHIQFEDNGLTLKGLFKELPIQIDLDIIHSKVAYAFPKNHACVTSMHKNNIRGPSLIKGFHVKEIVHANNQGPPFINYGSSKILIAQQISGDRPVSNSLSQSTSGTQVLFQKFVNGYNPSHIDNVDKSSGSGDVIKTRGRVFFEDQEKDVKSTDNPIDPGGTSLKSDEATRKVQFVERVKLRVNTNHSNATFDRGGISSDSREVFCKVELFGHVMKLINKERVDVPFDPGGFVSKTKLEVEFFRRRGV